MGFARVKYIHCFFLLFGFLFFWSCTQTEPPQKIAAIVDRSKMPRLKATDITTIISDSGITRYRITTPVWDIYDRASQPYWEFPRGIQFEQFDEKLKVDANLHSNYAKFLEYDKLWELRGNVKMTNIRGQLMETNLLYWDQRTGKFYSDSAISITDAAHIIKGVGFESNQNMTNYHIKKTKGIFPVEKE